MNLAEHGESVSRRLVSARVPSIAPAIECRLLYCATLGLCRIRQGEKNPKGGEGHFSVPNRSDFMRARLDRAQNRADREHDSADGVQNPSDFRQDQVDCVHAWIDFVRNLADLGQNHPCTPPKAAAEICGCWLPSLPLLAALQLRERYRTYPTT